MPIITPISDLRNRFNEISDICHREAVPVFMTKNGKGDLVVTSQALYERQQALVDLYRKLGETEAESIANQSRITHSELMPEPRSRYHKQWI